MADTVADVLERAAELIAAPGKWYHGSYTNTDGPCYCAATAIDHVAGSIALGRRIRFFFGNQLPATHLDAGAHRIWCWNDAPSRTQDEVVAKLREAAAKARAESLA